MSTRARRKTAPTADEPSLIVSDEVFGAAVRALLLLRTGAAVDFFGGMLSIGQLENGNFYVCSGDAHGNELWTVDDITLDEALVHFLRLRRERQLGFDIERQLYREQRAREPG